MRRSAALGALFLALSTSCADDGDRPFARGLGSGGGHGAATPSDVLPDPVHEPPAISDPEVVVPGPGMPAEYLAENGISNNNVDVVRHAGRVFLAVRNGKYHFASPDTRIYVFSSTDQEHWDFEAKITYFDEQIGSNVDVREPRFLSYKGRLFLHFVHLGKDMNDFTPRGTEVVEYLGPKQWSEPTPVYRPHTSFLVWRTRVVNDRAYLLAYTNGEHEYDFSGLPMGVVFLTSDDGLAWKPVEEGKPIVESGGGSETDFALDDAGDLYAVMRNEPGDETGWGSKICRAPKDHLATWDCSKHDPKKYDSPYVFSYRGEIFLIGRRNLNDTGNFELDPNALPWSGGEALSNLAKYSGTPKRCALWQLERRTLTVRYIADVPGFGDTCYAEMIPHETDPKTFFLYNYSSDFSLPQTISWHDGQLMQTVVYKATVTFW